MACHNLIRYLVDDVLNELICHQRNNPVILKEIQLPVFPLHGEGVFEIRTFGSVVQASPTYGYEFPPSVRTNPMLTEVASLFNTIRNSLFCIKVKHCFLLTRNAY